MKSCRECKKRFEPRRPMQVVCSLPCSIRYASSDTGRKRAADDKKKLARREKKNLNNESLDFNHKKTQAVFNKWIRMRDIRAGHGCISCGTKADVQYCAGHYRSRGAASQLRYTENNVFLQCNSYCNNNLSGNLVPFRKNLIERIGIEAVEALDNNNEIKKWTVQELRHIRADYDAREKLVEKYMRKLDTAEKQLQKITKGK